MFDTETEVVDYCKYIVKCLADENYCELESKGILEIVPEEDLKRVLKEYDKDKKITMPREKQFWERIDIIKYNNQTGYTVDIDVFLDNELSDLTLQVELLYNGKVTIEDLHVL